MVISVTVTLFSIAGRNVFSARLFSQALEEPFLEAEASQTCNNSDIYFDGPRNTQYRSHLIPSEEAEQVPLRYRFFQQA